MHSPENESITQLHHDAFVNDVIRMAWADEVSFERIKKVHGVCEAEVIRLMRRHLKPRSFKLWRARVTGRSSKHEQRARLRSLEREQCEPFA